VGSLMQHEAYAHTSDIRERTTHTGCDSTPAAAWQHPGSVTTASPPAYLLRIQALHQRFHRYHPTVTYLPGIYNTAHGGRLFPPLASHRLVSFALF
jgi:hypothetical protein